MFSFMFYVWLKYKGCLCNIPFFRTLFYIFFGLSRINLQFPQYGFRIVNKEVEVGSTNVILL